MSKSVIRFGIFCVVALGLDALIQAANKPRTVSSGTDAVQELLQVEPQASQSIDRRDILKPGTRPDSDPDTAWWQAGFIQTGKQWLRIEESIANGANAALLDEYQKQRAKLVDQPHGQWQLANWCRKNGLLDQERVHLLRVLSERDTLVKSDSVYERLGCQKVGDIWISPQERRDATNLNSEIEQSHKRWDSKFATWIRQLDETPKQRVLAEKQLSEITDPTAVPAIISSFCMPSQTLAEYGVKLLGQIPEYQASRALAGQAVFSEWKPIRMRAVELLKQRKFEEFVPDLLLLLSRPIRIEVAAAPSKHPPGTEVKINWDYAWIEESQDTIWVGMGRLVPTSLPAGIIQRRAAWDSNANGFYSADGHRLNDAEVISTALRDMTDELNHMRFHAERMSYVRIAMNERVGKILADCSNEPVNSEPKVWWDWWTTYSSVPSPSQKAVVVVVDERPLQPIIPTMKCSCLVAGTPVWTERGAVPIEQILPGDRVLSKNIQSGELRYQPVLQTTVRQPTAVHRFQVADDEIVASLGHHFWVSGEGWTRMRQLVNNQPLHTATGMHRIVSIVDEGRVEKVYNLVVADLHTYFVGKSMVLSHDVTTPSLTNVKVPGLIQK